LRHATTGLAAVALLALSGCSGGGSAQQAGNPLPTTPPVTISPAPAPVATDSSPVAPPHQGSSLRLVTAAHWSATTQGFRLSVRPSRAGRAHAATHPKRALTEALGAAGPRPLTLTSSMSRSLTNQLECHAVFARTKPRWNLETWRPDIGFTATVLAACNP
jgi:hypothetical protein